MKITVTQLRGIIKEEVQKASEPNFIVRWFGTRGDVRTADQRMVEWPGGVVLHPDEIQTIRYKGKSLRVERRKEITTPDGSVHKLYFTTPEGKTIEYTYYDDKEAIQAPLERSAQQLPTAKKKKSWVVYIFDTDENDITLKDKSNYSTRKLAVEARNKLFIEQLLSNAGYYSYDPDSKDPKIQQELFQDHLKQENAKADDDMLTDGIQEFWVADSVAYEEFASSLDGY